jgi:Domain of unknown function (DUF1789).
MAAKITLGNRPKTFRKIVKFPMLDGTEGAIEMIFKYRTRKEFGDFIDEIMNAAKVQPSVGEDGQKQFSMRELMEKTTGSNSDYILQVAEGWNVEDRDFTRENIEQLADEIPAATAAIMDFYRAAIVEGRLGN